MSIINILSFQTIESCATRNECIKRIHNERNKCKLCFVYTNERNESPKIYKLLSLQLMKIYLLKAPDFHHYFHHVLHNNGDVFLRLASHFCFFVLHILTESLYAFPDIPIALINERPPKETFTQKENLRISDSYFF